ncbi:MAG: hypothetical protein PVH61_39635 [Candidatus Aminicenantes bacterium]|jgi:hypothetical protein
MVTRKQLRGKCQAKNQHPDVHVFCDATPHDDPKVREMDEKRRQVLRDRGEQVLAWNYKYNSKQWLVKRPDIFKKVK